MSHLLQSISVEMQTEGVTLELRPVLSHVTGLIGKLSPASLTLLSQNASCYERERDAGLV